MLLEKENLAKSTSSMVSPLTYLNMFKISIVDQVILSVRRDSKL